MNIASSLIVDQKLINSAQDVWNYADNIATKCNLLTNDLILSAVWYCLNGVKNQRDSLSKNLNEKIVIDALQSGDKPAAVSENRSCKSVTPGKADDKSVTDPVSGWVLEHIDVKSTKITPDSKESPIVIDCGSQKTITGPRDVPNVGNKNVTSQNKCSNNGAAKFGKTVVSTPVTQTNKTVKSQGTRNVQDLDASGVAKISKENQNKKTAVNVQASSNVNLISSARQKLNSALTNSHSEKPVQKDKTIAEGVEIISIDDDDDEVEIADNDVSCKEITVSTEDVAEEGDKNKEIVQEDEPDYFDMDCDEIEDDNYNEEETYDTSNVKVISPSTSHKVKVVSPRKSNKEKVILPSKSAIENVEGNDGIIKDTKLKAVVADVTVISDDESEEDEKSTITSAEKSSCLGTSNKSNLSSTKSNNEIDSYGKGSKRKQSFIDIKVEDDIDGNDDQCVEENEEGNNQLDSIQKGSKRSRKQSFNDIKVKCDTKDKSISNNENDGMCNPVAATFTCPVMEELDSMSMKRSSAEIMSSLDMQRTLSDIKSTENSVSEAGNQTSSHSQSSAVAMLGLVPVQIIQKSTSEVINAAEQTKPSAMALLGMGQTFYVTSGVAQGSISSLQPFQGVNLAESSNTAANRFSDLYHSSNTQSTDLVTGVEYDQTETADTASGTPAKKKRLLDFDKKWHMQPKYSPDQDKYLALPGGIDGNSVSVDDSPERDMPQPRRQLGDPDWKMPGKYTSISHYPTVPKIGMEIVDSDFSNYHRVSYTTDDSSVNHYSDADDDEDNLHEESLDDNVASSSVHKRGRRGSGITIRGRGKGRGKGRGTKTVSKHGGESTSRGSTRGSVRGRRGIRGSTGVRRGLMGRGSSVKKTGYEATGRDSSPTKFHTLARAAGLSPVTRKIGFFSVKLGVKGRGNSGRIKRRGTGESRVKTARQALGGQSRESTASTYSTKSRGNTRGQRGRSRGKKIGLSTKSSIVID